MPEPRAATNSIDTDGANAMTAARGQRVSRPEAELHENPDDSRRNRHVEQHERQPQHRDGRSAEPEERHRHPRLHAEHVVLAVEEQRKGAKLAQVLRHQAVDGLIRVKICSKARGTIDRRRTMAVATAMAIANSRRLLLSGGMRGARSDSSLSRWASPPRTPRLARSRRTARRRPRGRAQGEGWSGATHSRCGQGSARSVAKSIGASSSDTATSPAAARRCMAGE